MEARRFGFGSSVPPAYKFDPTDADIVAHYLLPRAVGVPNPYEHAIIDADPYSCPPWELMRRHGHAGSYHAFFFGPAAGRTETGRRYVKCAVPDGEEGGGGNWTLQRFTEDSLVVVRGGEDGGAERPETKLSFKKYSRCYTSNENGRSTGWVMHEYEITDPPLPGAVLSRIRRTRTNAVAKKKRKEPLAAAAAPQPPRLPPGPDQPGPSNYLDDDGPVAANYIVTGHGEGTSGAAQAEAVHQGDNIDGFLGEMVGYYSALPNAGEDGSYYYSALPNAGEDGGYYYYSDLPIAGEDGGYYSALPVPSAGETTGYYSALPMPSAGETSGYYSSLPVPSAGETTSYYSALPMPSTGETTDYCSALPGAGEDGGYYTDNSNNYFSEGISAITFTEGDGDYVLQDDGGYSFIPDDGGDYFFQDDGGKRD